MQTVDKRGNCRDWKLRKRSNKKKNGRIWSITEGFPIAKYANELGFNVVVVNYRVSVDCLLNKSLDDLANTIKYMFENTEEFNIIKDDYLVVGFSAGGHLVSTYGTKHIGYESYNLKKPAALILSYPVITMGDLTHEGPRDKGE